MTNVWLVFAEDAPGHVYGTFATEAEAQAYADAENDGYDHPLYFVVKV